MEHGITMMLETTHASAIDDFLRARRKGRIRAIQAMFQRRSNQLLAFDEVRQKLGAVSYGWQELRVIPLSAIVGSVNRYEDFTRDFLPRESIDPHRWANVKQRMHNLTGLDPIQVYQIGEVYFVIDGNHRVSVARETGLVDIQAYVTEVKSRVTITPDMEPEELILKAELVEFLQHTSVDHLLPEADLSVTVPGGYRKLEEHIDVHRYFMGLEKSRAVTIEEAVVNWHETVYLPVTRVIRQKGLLHDFPQKTETDLYLWLGEYSSQYDIEFGGEYQMKLAADHLAHYRSTRLERVISRVWRRIGDRIIPATLEPGPPPGEWRAQKESGGPQSLFGSILVPVNGREDGWNALEQALLVAAREGSILQGLHVVGKRELVEGEKVDAVRETFENRCREAGIPGRLIVTKGNVTQNIWQRTFWNDLAVINLAYPPNRLPMGKLNSGFRALVLRSPRPLLVAPRRISALQSAILAYDDSPKAQEALYVSAYLAGKWNIPLTVLTICEEDIQPQTVSDKARAYLERLGVRANYLVKAGPSAQMILLEAEAHDADFIIMGGYGDSPLVNIWFESLVDKMLRRSNKPMLLCR